MAQILAIDISGSTSWCNGVYWPHVDRIHLDKKWDYVIGWDDNCEIYTGHKSRGGTNPIVIPKWLDKMGITDCHLTVITDGEIGSTEVAELREYPKSFASVTAHIINTELDVSVMAPFCEAAKTSKVYFNLELVQGEEVDQKVLDRIAEIKTVSQLLEQRDELAAIIANKNVGRPVDEKTIAALRQLRNRLIVPVGKVDGAELLAALDRGEHPWKLIEPLENQSQAQSVLSAIHPLIHLCSSLAKKFSVGDSIATARQAMAKPVAEAEPAPVPGGDYECPVTFETEWPAVMIHDGVSPLADQPSWIVNAVTDNPLAFLSFPHLVSRAKACIGKTLGAGTVGKVDQCPFTRKPIKSVVYLMPGYHNAWGLSQLFTDGKRLGDPHVWFLVFAALVREIEWIDMPEEVVKKALLKRVLLGINPQLPNVKVPLRVALWYILHSNDRGIWAPLAKNAWALPGAIKFYKVEPERVELARWIWLLRWTKTNGLVPHSNFWFSLVSRYARVVDLPRVGTILEDGAPTPNRDGVPSELANYTLDEIDRAYYFWKKETESFDRAICKPLMKECDPYWKTFANDSWSYKIEGGHRLTISQTTCRPIYQVSSTKTWRDQFYEKYGVLADGAFSGTEKFILYVQQFGAYPTVEQLAHWCWKCYLQSESQHHLKAIGGILIACKEILADYEEIMKTVSPAEFSEKTLNSLKIEARQKLEKSLV